MKLILIAVLTLTTVNVFAKDILCRADKITSGDTKVAIPVTIIKGSQLAEVTEVAFHGKNLSVVWNQGDTYEPQTYLSMNFGDVSSKMYDLNLEKQRGPINVLVDGDLRFQCWAV